MAKNKRIRGKVEKAVSPAVVGYRSRDQQYAEGKAIRDACPRANHAGWKPPAGRVDTIEMLEASNKGRLPELIPVRYGRMIPSPFVFFRGAAAIMAADLAHTPTTGIRVQSCGDAHLMNFGAFATPERRLIFDINDFDETLPAPWEWDVKRLATSFLIASRSNGFGEADARKTALRCVRSYRERMNEFAQMRTLEVWYSRLDLETILPSIKDQEAEKRLERRVRKAEASDVQESDFPETRHIGKGGANDPGQSSPDLPLERASRLEVRGQGGRRICALPGDAARRAPRSAGSIPEEGLGHEGRWCGKRRHVLCHPLDDGRRG